MRGTVPRDRAPHLLTWRRLEPVFRLPGRVVYGADMVHVELRSFNDR